MSNLNATPPFSAWGYGERHRCDFCGQYESLPGSRVSPQHKPDCKWGKNERRNARRRALRLLGITAAEVRTIKAMREAA
jgi:hypothetical protein